jgi:hypothetical protein
VIDNVGNFDGLFTLTIPNLMDRLAEAVTRLLGVFHTCILLDAANDGLRRTRIPVGSSSHQSNSQQFTWRTFNFCGVLAKDRQSGIRMRSSCIGPIARVGRLQTE